MPPETDDEQGREGPVQRVVASTRAATKAVAGAVVDAARAVGTGTPQDPHRWQVVTVLRTPEEVLPGGARPGPLADLGDAVEVETRLAPGDRGTELAARLRPGAALPGGQDPRRAVRTGLRESKMLLEVGEILRRDPQPEGRRKPTPTGALLDAVVHRSQGEGAL